MSWRISTGIHLDDRWRELLLSLPTAVDDDMGWDDASRRLQMLQQRWGDENPDLTANVYKVRRLPFWSVSVAYSMQTQSVLARMVREFPSMMNRPPDPSRENIARWEYMHAQLTILREQTQHDDNKNNGRLASTLDQLIAELKAGMAEAASRGMEWSTSGLHPALLGIVDKLRDSRVGGGLFTPLLKDAWKVGFGKHNVSFLLSDTVERLRMMKVAGQVLDRLEMQRITMEWAREMAEIMLMMVDELETMTWRKPGAQEDMGGL